MVVVIKKKRRMGGGIGNGPPVRLGWLGEGFGLGATTVTATATAFPAASPAFQMTNDHNDNNSSNTRRDQSSATMAAIDLTGDNDDDDANGNDSGNGYARLETPRVMNNDHGNGSNNDIIINNDDYYSTDKSSDYFADSILHSANIGSRTNDHQRGQKPREEVGSSSSSSSNAIVKNAKVGKFTSSKRNPTASSNVAAAGGKQKSSALFATTAGAATKTSSFAVPKAAAAATERRSNEMWIDKYAPQTSTEVCMAPKKVDEIKSFLLSYITNNSEIRKRKRQRQRTNNTMSQKKQQQLCCYTKGDVVNYTNSNGEIYTCTILAVDIDDGMEPYYTIQLENDDNKHGSGGIREKQTDNAHLSPLLLDDAAAAPSPSSPPSILLQTKLLILAGSPGIGKSATIHALANEMSIEVLTWDDAHVEYSNNNNHNDGGGGDYYIPYQSQLNSFEEFLSQSGAGVQSLEFVLDDDDDDGISSSKRKATNNSNNKTKNYVGSLILIEEIPNLYNSEVEQTFRSIVEKHIHTSQIPTIYIYSDVNEGKVDPKELERLFSPQLLYDSNKLINVLQIQPVTKSKMKKCLQSIVKSEGLESSSRRGGRRQDSKLPASFYDEIHLSSGGDIRHAIFDMQFRFTSLTTTTTLSAGTTNTLLCDQISNIGNSCSSSSTKKDTKLSAFHALGKLLYAKRKVRQQSSSSLFSTGWDSEEDVTECTSMLTTTTSHLATSTALKSWDDGRGPLEFIPEDILLQTDMGISSAITFLSYHSPDFFTDITELCTSHELLSDTALFIDRLYDGSGSGGGGDGGGPFPMDYAACIGSRAVAHANIHPAPSRFRQFTAPKVFSVLKKNRENENKIKQLRKRLSVVSSTGGGDDSCNHDGGSKTSIRENIGSATQFVTNSLPYIRIVIPQDVNFALSNLHSYAKTSDESASLSVPSTVVEENCVLLEDDLMDDDDEW